MTSTVVQEPIKFRPVIITIDDERTVNLLRYILEDNVYKYQAYEVEGAVCTLDTRLDANFALAEIADIVNSLMQICNK